MDKYKPLKDCFWYAISGMLSIGIYVLIGKFNNSVEEVMPEVEVEVETLPIVVQNGPHALLRVDDFEVGAHCFFWEDSNKTVSCVKMDKEFIELD